MPIPPIVRKLFTISGILPLGAFLLEHLYVAGSALRGERALASSMRILEGLPRALEIALILVPLALHAAFGIFIIAFRVRAPLPYLYATRVTVMMRLTAIIALAFIAFHVYEFRVRVPGVTPESAFSVLAARLSTTESGIPVYALFYLLGVTATVFHFTAGLWGSLVMWRLIVSERAKSIGRWGFGVLGLALCLVGANAVVCLATGTRYFAPSEMTPLELEPPATSCPQPAASP